jgi:hypothetical protein
LSIYAWAFVRRTGLSTLLGIWLAGSGPAHAASLTSRDLQIIAKALGFLDPAPPGGSVAVVYEHTVAGSKDDAEAIVRLFGEGLDSGGGKITGRAIDAGLLGNGTGYIAIIMAAGAEDQGAVSARPRGLLSITAADGLVRSGRCVMAVHSEPRVEIIVNRAAAQAAGVGFTAAFGMLVHEI